MFYILGRVYVSGIVISDCCCYLFLYTFHKENTKSENIFNQKGLNTKYQWKKNFTCSYQFFSRIVTYPMNSKFSTCKYDISIHVCSIYATCTQWIQQKKRMAYLHVCTTVSPYLSTSKGQSSVWIKIDFLFLFFLHFLLW